MLCRNESNGAVQTKTDTTGTEFYIHVINPDVSYSRDDGDTAGFGPGPDSAPDAERSSVEIIDKAYRLLLSELTLSDFHRDLLRSRKMSDEQIKRGGYRSFPFENRIRIADKIADRIGEANARGVPGMWVKQDEESGRSYWKLSGWKGLLIPLRNGNEQIVALKVRDDEKKGDGKYTYVSSRAHGGASAIQSVHVPLGVVPGDVVRITEGELKADIATALSGVPTLSIPGVSNYQLVLPMLDTDTLVRVAFDADHATKPIDKPTVALALVELCRALYRRGLKWELEVWDDRHGNGIDDVLAGGHGADVRVLSGTKAQEHIVWLEEKYRPKKSAKELAVEAKVLKQNLAAKAVEEERKRYVAESATTSTTDSAADPIVAKSHRVPRHHAPVPQYLALGDHPELASVALRLIRSNSSEKLVYDREKFWRYEDLTGLWNDIDEGEIWDELGRCSGIPIGGPQGEPFRVMAKDVRGAIDFASTRVGVVRKGFFDEASSGIAFTNCFVDINETHEVVQTPHAASRRAVHGMPFAYDPNAKAPKWEKYLAEVFSFTTEEDRAARISLIEEWLGAVILGDVTKYALCLLLIGTEGNNGKSVLLYVMEELVRLIHPNAVQAIPPRHWGNVHHLAGLDGCRLNSINEMPDSDIESGETFKAVVAGDPVDVARKYGDPYRMRPRAGQVFAANAAPGTRDQSGGFWRRWGVLTFERTFVGLEINMNLRQELVSEELPGIVARVIAAAARLSRRGRFILPESATAAREEWRLESDQVRQFVLQCTRTRQQDEEELQAVAEDRFKHDTGCDPAIPSPTCSASPEEHEEMEARQARAEEAQEAIELADGVPDQHGFSRKKRKVYNTTPQLAFDAYWQWTKRSGHACLTSQKFWKRLHVVCQASGRKGDYRFFLFRITKEWSERRVLPISNRI